MSRNDPLSQYFLNTGSRIVDQINDLFAMYSNDAIQLTETTRLNNLDKVHQAILLATLQQISPDTIVECVYRTIVGLLDLYRTRGMLKEDDLRFIYQKTENSFYIEMTKREGGVV